MGRFAILLAALAACVDQPQLAVDKSSIAVPRGAGTNLDVSLDGQPLALADLVWLVDDSTIATIAPTSDGSALRVGGVGEGVTTIHLGSHGQIIDLPTHVSPPAFVQLWIDPAAVAAPIGTAVAIHATAIDTTDTIRDVSDLTDWQVMDPAIATLDDNMVHGANAGHTMLQAVLPGTQSSIPITVY